MHKRFRDHTCDLFKKHGMELVGFWSPRDEKEKDNLVYILAFPSKEAAAASWKAFGADPEWIKVRDASEKDQKSGTAGLVCESDAAAFRPVPGLPPGFHGVEPGLGAIGPDDRPIPRRKDLTVGRPRPNYRRRSPA